MAQSQVQLEAKIYSISPTSDGFSRIVRDRSNVNGLELPHLKPTREEVFRILPLGNVVLGMVQSHGDWSQVYWYPTGGKHEGSNGTFGSLWDHPTYHYVWRPIGSHKTGEGLNRLLDWVAESNHGTHVRRSSSDEGIASKLNGDPILLQNCWELIQWNFNRGVADTRLQIFAEGWGPVEEATKVDTRTSSLTKHQFLVDRPGDQ